MKEIELYQRLKRNRFVVLDLETTGFSPEKHSKITEIAAIKIEDGKFVEQFQTLINPEVKIPKKIIEVTGIDDEMVKDAPIFEEVLPHLFNFIKDSVVVCHNIEMDWTRFLTYYFNQVGLQPVNLTLDTIHLFKRVYPTKSKKANLTTMTEVMGVSLEGHHRAMNDTIATAKCFLQMRDYLIEEYENRLKWEFEDNETTSHPLLAVYPTLKTQVIRANYWEKEIKKKTTYRRLYVSLRDGGIFGKVYYDFNRGYWYNDNFPYTLNFKWVEEIVKQKMNISSLKDVLTSSSVSTENSMSFNAFASDIELARVNNH